MSRPFLSLVLLAGMLLGGVAAAEEVTFLLTLGLGARQTERWDGSIEIEGGELLGLEERDFAPYRPIPRIGSLEPDLEPRVAEITGPSSWRVEVRVDGAPSFHRINYLEMSPAYPLPTLYFPASLFVTLRDAGGARVTVRTVQGSFTFSPRELSSEPALFLEGRAKVARSATVRALSAPHHEDDEPAMAALPGGGTAVGWIAYRDGADRILLRTQERGAWSAPEEVGRRGDLFRCSLAVGPEDALWVFWSERDGTRWQIWGTRRTPAGWQAPIRLSEKGSNTFHRAASFSGGDIYLVWQSFRSDGEQAQSDVVLRVWDGASWSTPRILSESPANDWEPVVAAGPDAAHFAWDGYEAGNYDIFYRRYHDGRLDPVEQVTTSPRFQAHPSLAVDQEGRVWLAWDESGTNWGKDQGFLINPPMATPLHRERSIRVVRRDQGGWREVAVAIPEFDLYRLYPNFESPHLAFDGNGTLTLLFRHWTRLLARFIGAPLGWENFVTRLEAGRWTTPVPLPHSRGTIEKRPTTALTAHGELHLAWMSDDRSFASLMKPGNAEIYTAALAPSRAGPPRPGDLVAFEEPWSEEVPIHLDEAGDIARVRGYTVEAGSRRYRIWRGDLHRHSDVSPDFKYDGSLIEVYRYALDAAALDFIAPTDHQSGYDQEFTWWQDEKLTDLFHLPGVFTPLFGYERSLPYPNGHRNVIFARRGVRTLPIPRQEVTGEQGAAALYRYLHQNDGISMPHSSGTDQGTDWRDNDPEVEPLIEIFQGYRASYEYPGAPKAASEQKLLAQRSGYQSAGYWWNALAQGLKLGVQASSDHWSTHISYACLLAPELSREALFEAIKKRHAYGATDNIVLDFQARTRDHRVHIMGDVVEAQSAPKLRVRVLGTDEVAQLVIVKNQRIVFESRPGTSEVDLEFVDQDFEVGDVYYYVRVLQGDGNMAWSSPIWVEAGS